MTGRECYHCKQWVEEGEKHDCWTTTEGALTRDLSEDLQDAWERLRETAASFGEQRIYASHKSIMFSRKSCYFFVRPKKSFLEVCVFLGRPLKAPQVRRVDRVVEVQGRALPSHQAPRRGRGAGHRLASGSVRAVGGPGLEGQDRTRENTARGRPRAEETGEGGAKANDHPTKPSDGNRNRGPIAYLPSNACCSRVRSSLVI